MLKIVQKYTATRLRDYSLAALPHRAVLKAKC